MLALVPDSVIDEPVTVFPLPTLALLNVQLPIEPVTVSPDRIPDNDAVHVAIVVLSYVLLLAFIPVKVNALAVIFAVVVALVVLKKKDM